MNWRATWQARWHAASRREQRSLMLAAGVVALALLWWLGIAPALAVWRTAPTQQALLDAQMQQMLVLQAQARALQALPTLDAPEARRALEDTLTPLGQAAQLSAQMDRVTVTLTEVSAAALAQWLASSRQNAHLVPTEVRLQRVPAADGSWSGSVVFTLPAQ